MCALSRPPSPFLDLCYVEIVDAATGDVLSGEEPMGDDPADAASALPLGELSRVVQACRVLFCISSHIHLSICVPVSSFSIGLTLRLRAIGNGSLICVCCSGPMAEAPEESIVPGLFPSVLLLCFAEPCVLADPTEVDEFDLHVFCPISVVRFVRACYSTTLVCRFLLRLVFHSRHSKFSASVTVHPTEGR